MNITQEQKNQIVATFSGLDRPHKKEKLYPGCLPELIEKKFFKFQQKFSNGDSQILKPEESALFASAAIDMWHRAVHSFLLSVFLTESSPIWASVSGYYSSHYCVRGLAHSLGFFKIRRRKCIVTLKVIKGKTYCFLFKKSADDREHDFYWREVNKALSNNPFFTKNPDDSDESDSAHRAKANYYDHLVDFYSSPLKVMEESKLIERIDRLSKMELSDVPIPNRKKFPDVDTVHVIAYHRIVLFQNLLDNILESNKYWLARRNPAWCSRYISFRIIPPRFLEAYNL